MSVIHIQEVKTNKQI